MDEVLRLRWGGVGAFGLRGGVAPLDFIDPVGVDVRLPPEAVGRNLIEEYGEAPLDMDMLAYKTTPRSLWPASMATAKAVRPSLSLAKMSVSGCVKRCLTMSV